MEWKIDYLEEEGIVTAKVTGVMDWGQHRKFAEEVFPFAKEHGSHKVLIDFLEMTPNFTIHQIDDLPNMLAEAGVGREFKIAAVYDPTSAHSSEFRFFKDVAKLMSIKVMYFSSVDEAMEWLSSA